MSRRRNPFDDLEEFFERFSRQFEDQPGFDQDVFGMGGSNRMSIDLADRDEEFVVTADAPGFSKEEIDVRVTDRRLTIEANRDERSEESDEIYLRSERHSEALRRTIQLPEPVEEDGVSATYKNGVLTITLPKREPETGGKSIDIE
ncbi:small heat shock protein HSP16.5 [Halalkalicoccus paucihalophilus]|uniref:Small heat shock protein HSP16.5 n=1 Tax=Halalkalicoccus paucihalophilus TaxID=1008153 RepID=A0A151AI02_9EURY|nr:Hsp20/alpha crystallin family protein [Halalkalicoccus paucihalophilus]KYH27205.1 small heat shock protein HSP16.5 [Halalkalicoccus paucihalophilus]